MKFIHLGDVHLGAKPDSSYPWGKERELEIWSGLKKVIEACNKDQVDLLLIAGDFFHKQPLVRELKEANYIFSQLENTKVVIIAGNHDYISPRSNYIKFEWCKNVHMLMDDKISSVFFEDINTQVYGLSYHKREIKDPVLDEVEIQNKEKINILLAHGGTPSNIPMDVKKIKRKGFDYIALGHIHKPQKLGERIAYAGSMEPLDKNEIGKRGFIRGQIIKNNKDSILTFDFIEHARRQYIPIKLDVHDTMTNGELQDLAKDKIKKYDKKHIFQFTIKGYRDPDIKFELDKLTRIGNVIDVADLSLANYNFDQLYKENEDNIIGDYIAYIRGLNEEEKIKTKALFYGIETLLHAKGNS